MRIILFFAFLLTVQSVFSQNVLELKNNQTGKTRIIKNGAKLHFKTKGDDEFVKGKIVQIKDSMLVLYVPDRDEEMPLEDVKLSDLTAIKKPTGFHGFSRSAGAVILPIGGVLFLNGLFPLLRDEEFQGKPTYDKDAAKLSTFGGAGLLVIGTIPFLIKPKEYNLLTEWSASVIKN